MSLLDKKVTDTEVLSTTSGFGFSGVSANSLQNSEYTLVVIATDTSGSVHNFTNELEKCYTEIIAACRKNPRADNMLIRAVSFSTSLKEDHGFIPVSSATSLSYAASGNTALHDAILEATESVESYASVLKKTDVFSNGVVFVVTDGCDNSSRVANPQKIADRLEKIRKDENLDSIKVILIGVGDKSYENMLNELHLKAKLDQFVWVGSADAKNLAKMANFISRSISSSSQSLGSGGPSQNLTV